MISVGEHFTDECWVGVINGRRSLVSGMWFVVCGMWYVACVMWCVLGGRCYVKSGR